ncbi:hypothetical protein KJ068_16550 [bacterium]|nr:hypothetical protein [bacterium]
MNFREAKKPSYEFWQPESAIPTVPGPGETLPSLNAETLLQKRRQLFLSGGELLQNALVKNA